MERGLVADSDGRALDSEAPYVAHLRLSYFREVEKEVPLGQAEILFADEHLVVADKPPFLPVTPGGRFVRNCLLYQVEEILGVQGLALAHRIDRATSGLVLLTRKAEERGAYSLLFEHQKVQKTYLAVSRVAVCPREERWKVASRIVKGEPFFRMREEDGEANAWTDVELRHWQDGWGHFVLRPRTGKTHQLRLHLTRLGWPIEGDRFYPSLRPEAPDDPARPLALVAHQLEFDDPLSGEKRTFASRLWPLVNGVVHGPECFGQP